MELLALKQILPELKEWNANVVALSPELSENAQATHENNDIPFHLLCDANNKVAQAAGLVFEFGKDLVDIYQDNWQLDLTKWNGTETFALPIPASFVIGQDGVIQYAFSKADYTKRAEPTDILTCLKNM